MLARIAASVALLLASPAHAELFDQSPVFMQPVIVQTPPPITPLSFDGTPQPVSGVSTATMTMTVTTTKTNDVVYIAADCGASQVSGVTDAQSALSFVNRFYVGRGTSGDVEVWDAPSPTALTADVITVTCSGSIFNTGVAFAINGTSPGSQWDSNVSLPASAAGSGPPTYSGAGVTVSTTHGNDWLLSVYSAGASAPVHPAGFTDIFSGGYFDVSIEAVTAPQSGTSIVAGSAAVNEMVVDAIQGQ